MPLLLDTHVWVWSQAAPERLGEVARAVLEDADESLHLATVSTLEVARLVEAGRLELAGSVMDWVTASTEQLGAGTLELSHEIAAGAYALPGAFHRDPADRILVSTARRHELVLLTADERILGYPHVASQDARC